MHGREPAGNPKTPKITQTTHLWNMSASTIAPPGRDGFVSPRCCSRDAISAKVTSVSRSLLPIFVCLIWSVRSGLAKSSWRISYLRNHTSSGNMYMCMIQPQRSDVWIMSICTEQTLVA